MVSSMGRGWLRHMKIMKCKLEVELERQYNEVLDFVKEVLLRARQDIHS